jgi:3-oxoacyl-[acyl-carrier-protein] synthase-3
MITVPTSTARNSAADRHAVICGAGAWLPPRVVTNDDLASYLDTSNEWITSRTGIRARHVVDRGMATSDLATEAGTLALKSAGGGDVDAVVLATTTPDRLCPATAPEVAARLGLTGVAAWDVSAVCSGFLYGLASAVGVIASGTADRVLLIGAEAFSTIINPNDRTTAVIFADGAGAVVLRAGTADELGTVGPCVLGSDGSGSDLICIPAGGARQRSSGEQMAKTDHYFQMRGGEVYRHAVQQITDCSLHALHRAGWRVQDVDRFVPHQANIRICTAVAEELGISENRRVSNIDRVGNTAAASIPLLLAQAAAAGELRPGHRVLIAGFGGGLTWGAATLVWPDITAFAAIGDHLTTSLGEVQPPNSPPHPLGESMYEQLKQIMERKFQVPIEDIEPAATLNDLGLDSLDLVELALAIEREIGVRVTDDDLAEAGRLDSIVDLVMSRSATV